MGSTLKAITEGKYAMSFGRGSSEHWKTLGLPVVTEAILRDYLGMLRQLWTDGFVLDHDGPAGKCPVLHNLHGLDGRRPAARAGRGRAEDDGAGRRAVRLRRHAHVLLRAGDDVARSRRSAGAPSAPAATRTRSASGRAWPPYRTASPRTTSVRRGVGRLVTYFQAYGDTLVTVNGWDPGAWEKLKTSELFIEASGAGGAIDATASTETLQRLGEMVPEEWLDASAHGRPEDAARTIARELELGCHSVILHGAEPHELAPMVAAYRAVRPELERPVATNPGLFA